MLDYVFKNCNLFVDGSNYAGKVATLTPPNLELILEDFRGGGMDAAQQIDMGMQAMTAAFTMNTYPPEIWQAFGVGGGQKTQFQMRGALQSQKNVSDVKAVEFFFNASITSTAIGELVPGQASRPAFNISSIDYYKMVHDGTIIHEIDIPNQKRIINGVDQLEAINQALGTSKNINIAALTQSAASQSRRSQAGNIISGLGI